MRTVPAIPRQPEGPAPLFSAVLRPHRSLGQKGFVILMAAVCLVSFAAGIAFLMIGAWPVLGFFGLDALLIYWAFKVNYARARDFEMIALYEDELVIRRVSPKRQPREWRFHPYWVRLELEEDEELETCGPLWLTSHGKRLRIGAFLGPDQLRDISQRLDAALAGTKKI